MAPSPHLSSDKPVLIDTWTSYYGSRVRFAIYLKGLEDEFVIKSPSEFGGLKSPTFLAWNPQGKMPILILPPPDGRVIPESEVITQYIFDKYASSGSGQFPKMSTVEGRLNENLLKRLLDTYVGPLITAVYAPMKIRERAEQLAELRRQIDLLDGYVIASPYAAGEEFSTADIAMFPQFAYLRMITAFAFGWEDVFKGCPNLARWWETIAQHPVAQRVQREIEVALDNTLDFVMEDTGVLDQVQNTSYRWKLC